MENAQDINEYDLEPVSYCPKCYSLKIGYIPGVDDSDYCMDCGCLDVAKANIYDWEKLYENRYGHKYVVKRGKYTGHPLWNLSIRGLRVKLLESPYYMDIIKEVIPEWSYNGDPVETVFLFIDHVVNDKLLSKLKKVMISRYRNKQL